MTLIELCIVIVILAILLIVAIAGVMRARLSSNEASAIASLRAIYSAQFAYAAGCGPGNYATTLLTLTTRPRAAGRVSLTRSRGVTPPSGAGIGSTGARPGRCGGQAGLPRVVHTDELLRLDSPDHAGRYGQPLLRGDPDRGGLGSRLAKSPPAEPFGSPAPARQVAGDRACHDCQFLALRALTHFVTAGMVTKSLAV